MTLKNAQSSRLALAMLLGSEPRHCPRCGEKVQAETGRRAVNSPRRPPSASTQLADRVEHLVHAGAKRPDNLVGNLLRKPTELLSLSPKGLELFARVRVGKRNYLGRRLRREELLGKVECGVGVDPGYLDHLHTVIGRALGDGRIGRLEQFCRLLDCGLQFLVAPLRLDDRTIGIFAECGRNLDL